MEDKTMPFEEAVKKYSGRMNDADASASVTGACGGGGVPRSANRDLGNEEDFGLRIM